MDSGVFAPEALSAKPSPAAQCLRGREGRDVRAGESCAAGAGQKLNSVSKKRGIRPLVAASLVGPVCSMRMFRLASWLL